MHDVFIFDELFETMVSGNEIAALKDLGANVHIITQKCDIATCAPVKHSANPKIFCINPDFVDWDFAADKYKDIPDLRLIISSSDNLSWLDLQYADAHGIRYRALENLTTEYAAVAEYAITMMTSLARNIPLLSRAGFPLDYAQDFVKYQGVDIAGKTAGIVGLGNVGGAIAKRCEGLGMKVVYWSRTEKPGSTYDYLNLDDVLRRADVLFPTLKPNAETMAMLPNEKLATLKPDAIVVSVVSGLIDNDYLAKRAADKRLFGFGFGADPQTFSAFSGNVWAIPDYAWATRDNMRASYAQFLEKIREAMSENAAAS